MAEVRVILEQVRRDGFPPVCAACGTPATVYRRRWFTWTPGRNVPAAMLGTWRYWKVTLDVPFCAADQSYFTRRWAPLLVIGLLAIGSGVGIYAYTDISHGAAAAQRCRKVIIPAVGVVLAVLYVIGKVTKRASIHVADVSGDGFTLAGVSETFAAATITTPVVLAADDPPEVLPADDRPRPDRRRRS